MTKAYVLPSKVRIPGKGVWVFHSLISTNHKICEPTYLCSVLVVPNIVKTGKFLHKMGFFYLETSHPIGTNPGSNKKTPNKIITTYSAPLKKTPRKSIHHMAFIKAANSITAIE